MINQAFFFYFSAVIVATSLLAITRKNVMHGVLYMLLLFFHIAGLYLFLNAEFISAVQVIVYAGAIMVLFLFVIMLLNLRDDIRKKQFIATWPMGLLVSSGILMVILMAMLTIKTGAHGVWGIAQLERVTQTVAIGTVMYTQYLFPFEVASLVLLVAIIGAIVLAKKRIK
ncbi:NADH-quinone oxidoreductase subunit J family protein [Candidatus Magnetominusculus xianensis]|uniref:NADH-quinone oxidoreductase subunit J n=1 Tax=Candidatus Magnetominusculus xianensis TaxID=1748249 RepID=A0ABR5SJ91_9BACT|nr:NADH-quinone oxidoreductase subunit J [Candidatus Magnetominusculus xianensis]KWT92051.1 NADH-ubiquinone oxidoreductase subunit J [Candidatus Magnetominusculus xianensis]MBF0404631.1 NADH-quinone oxidoreductase subunit J [Nitrospirota bacterium]